MKKSQVIAFALLSLIAMAFAPSQAAATSDDWHWTGNLSLEYVFDQTDYIEDLDITDSRKTTLSANVTLDGGEVTNPTGSIAGTYFNRRAYVSGEFSGSCTENGNVSYPRLGPVSDDRAKGQYLSVAKGGDLLGQGSKSEIEISGIGLRLSGTSSCEGDMSSSTPPNWGPDPEEPSFSEYGGSQRLRLKTYGADVQMLANGGFAWKGEVSSGVESETGGKTTWTYDLKLVPGSQPCAVSAASPQEVKSGALVLKVAGKSTGCKADLVRTKLKIGRKIFVSVKKLPVRQVGKGKTWTVKVPFDKATIARIRSALTRKAEVLAKAEFMIDGKKQEVTVRIK